MKTIETFLKKMTLLTLFFGVIVSCTEDDPDNDVGPDADPGSFQEVIAVGGEVESFPQARTMDTLQVSEPVNEDYLKEEDEGQVTERFVCTSRRVKVTDGNGTFPLFNTNADVIYPGSLLQGKTLSDASPSPIVVKRAGGTISYDLNNGNLNSSFSVDEVKKSSIQDAMNNIISTSGNVVPANFQVDIIRVESQSQLAIEMGIEVESFNTKVSGDFSFSTEKEFNRTLVKLTQSYYTMSFDLPTSLGEIFDESVTPEQLATFVQEDNPATFISSVTYGRIFYMLIESTSSRQEMSAQLNFAYESFKNKAKGEVKVDAFSSLKELKIKVIAYGGDAAGSFELTGETTVEAIASKLAADTDIRTGLPLSYVVRSVERPDQVVGTKLAAEYDIVDCVLRGTLPSTAYRGLVDVFEDGIGAAVHIRGEDIIVFSKEGSKYAWYNAGSASMLGKFDLNDPNGPLGVSGLDRIGAAIRYENNSMYFFDPDGLRMQIFNYSVSGVPSNTLPASSIGSYENNILLVNSYFAKDNAYPFVDSGIDAALRLKRFALILNPIKPNEIEYVRRGAYFSEQGSQYTLNLNEHPSLGLVWGQEFASTAWTSSSVDLFGNVGAATRVEFGNNQTEQLLFINAAGDQLMIWEGVFDNGPSLIHLPALANATSGTFKGPWVIN